MIKGSEGQISRNLVITIDGPAGAGKSTVARLLASRLAYLYLESGKLYRAIGWKVVQEGIDPHNEVVLQQLCDQLDVNIINKNSELRVLVDQKDVTDELKTPVSDQVTSMIAGMKPVRQKLLSLQQALGRSGGVVAEGRDMGTVVFPEASLKFYLNASEQVRARRRYQEMAQRGYAVDPKGIQDDLASRDRRDAQRELAPMQKPDDAVCLDSTDLTLEQVLDTIVDKIHQRFGHL